MRSRHRLGTLVLGAALVLSSACAPDVAGQTSGGLGGSDLAPTFGVDKKVKKQDKKERQQRKPRKPKRSEEEPAAPRTTGAAAPSKTAAPRAPATPKTVGPSRAAVSDPTGDVRGGLTGSPDFLDLTGAELVRTSAGFEIRVRAAGAYPGRQDGSNTMNVVSFFDLDGDGQVDYEVWASLADNGWSSSYRTPSGARFGDDSGVQVRPDGSTLVVSFPLGHLERARSFRWATGAEWGTYEQIASGTTASDNAPDSGVARFPG